MTVAVSKAVEPEPKRYFARPRGTTWHPLRPTGAGRDHLRVLIPEGKIAMGKLAQALVHGANVIQTGEFDKALTLAREISRRHRSRWSIRSTRVALRDKRPAPSKVIDALGEPRTSTAFRSATRANITRLLESYKNTDRKVIPSGCPGCGVFRPAAPRRS